MAKVKTTSCYSLKIQKDKCKGCGFCICYCPTKYLEFSSQLNKKGVKFAKIEKKNKCIGCGFCFYICPDCCIEIYEEK
jgi:2-oxoglutarate ferredoxin oxidoreductase subunit delta|tara:strand:- start:251 stop:484 length:234 start_codon:yes stop_codon:yes gene_type:complete